MKKILFICVSYNNSYYTEKFVNSLLLQSGIDVEFTVKTLVVDNSTSREDIEYSFDFGDKYKAIFECIRPKENIGYFGGLNYGLAHSDVKQYDFVIIGNNDLEFDSKFCLNLLKKTIDPNTFSIVPEVITADGVQQNPHVIKPISMRKRFEYDIFYSHWLVAKCLYFIKYNLLNLSKKQPFIKYKPQTIHMGIGAIYILTKNFFKSYNQLEFPLFLYGEEAFFSHQIHKVAGVIMFEPDLIVHHAESAATSKLPKRQVYEYSRKGYPLYRNYL